MEDKIILKVIEGDWVKAYPFFETFKKSPYYQVLLETYENLNTDILYKSRVHGQGHIERTILFALLLSYHYGLSKEDTDILRYAASLHDTQRKSDGYDTEHGYYAALYSASLSGLPEREGKILQAVMAAHSRDDSKMEESLRDFVSEEDLPRAKKLASYFKDCDGLDRVRLKDLDTSFLRNDFSKDLADFSTDLYKNYKSEENE